MVSSCNQIKRDSWSMNLCVETAPNVPTTLWEGGATRRGVWAWAPVPARVPRKAGSAASAASQGSQRLCCRGPGQQRSYQSPDIVPNSSVPRGGPLAPSQCQPLIGLSSMGVLDRVVFNLNLHQSPLGSRLKHRFLGPPLQHF